MRKNKGNEEKEKKILQDLFVEKKHIVAEILNNNKWGFDKDWESFIYGLAFTNPQTYGQRVQNRTILELNATSVPSSIGRGDYLNKNGRYVEMKTSLLTDSSSLMNVVQIRPWQETDYHVALVDMRQDKVKTYSFMLTKEQMKKELTLLSNEGTSAHGTKNINLKNKNIEKRFSINPSLEDENFQRWLSNYQVDLKQEKIKKSKKDKEITKKYKKSKTIISKIKKDKKWGFDKDWETFILGMSLMNPQTYGVRIQNRLMFELEMLKVQAKEEKGDFEDLLGNKFECKASVLINDKSKLNMVQIRPWQETGYKCVMFDLRGGNVVPYAFELTHEEMLEELDKIGHAAHGTKQANFVNNHIEYRISLNVDEKDENFARWLEKYKVDFDFSKKLSNEDIVSLENLNIRNRQHQKTILKKNYK